MPMLHKALHVAKNLDDLQKRANLEKKKIATSSTNLLCKSAAKLLHEAEKAHKENDEEMAFIYYFKFIDLVLFIKKRSDFQSNANSQLLSEATASAMDVATKLKNSLSQRYSALTLSDEKKASEILKNSSFHKIESEIDEEPEDKIKSSSLVIDTSTDHSISAMNLFNLMKDFDSSFLLLDIRSAEDFEDSRVKHSSCLNVPQEILTPGLTAVQLEELLPPATFSKWSLKNVVNHVILLDWDTRDTCLPQLHPLRTLEDAMVKWDIKNPLKKQPLILIGGYKEWLIRYPMYTTKAINVLSMHDAIPQNVRPVSEIDYPNLDEDLEEEFGAETVQNNRKLLSGFQNNQIINGWTDDKQRPSVNRHTKPNSAPSSVPSISSSRTFSPKVENSNQPTNQVPGFNRNLKPAIAAESAEFSVNLDQTKSVAKESLTITEQELEKERKFAQLRLQKELEAEESKRIELQKQEEMLLESLKKLQDESEQKEVVFMAMKEDNLRMKKMLADQFNEEQKHKESEIQKIDSINKNLQREVERLRQERKNKERKEAESKGKSHSAGEFRTLKENSWNNQVKYPDESEYTVPLKDSTDGSNRGLTRSFSSPNIAQLIEEENRKKLPTVDRTLKPNFDFNTRPSDFKTRNLNATFASVPGSATGLRNLGNTCYMNSIIQCLSNTRILANYFVDRRCENDIIRNSKHGTNGELVKEFAFVLRTLSNGTYKSFSPRDFKDIASKYIPMCVGYEQQDSHEFLVVLMDKLHGDLNKGRDISPLPSIDSLPESEAAERFWNHHRTKNLSKISETFEGLLKSTLTCLSCRKTSNSYEVFSCLSLPISNSRCTLKDSLTTFLKPEKMSGEGAWDCPSCRQKKEAEKSLAFCELPKVLVIQLKRFSYEGMWRRKIQSQVDFPMKLEMKANGSYVYSLYGIVNHFGYLEGGHYTAYCKASHTTKWYKYDDHDISEISPSDIVTSAAYLLFYSIDGN